MLTERLTFRAKYGQGDALSSLMKESMTVMPTEGIIGARSYTDFTGTMFTCVFEMDYPDIDAWAAATKRDVAEYGKSAFQAWFAKMVACTEIGERQLFNSEKII